MTEEAETSGLHSIGDIAKIAKISTDTLRYYDEIGLVKPALISKQTRYRYYSDSQVMTVLQILELKEYGFSLDEIKEILAYDAAELEDIYSNRYFDLMREKEKLQEVLEKLTLKIKQNREGLLMKKTVLIVDDATVIRMMLKNQFENEGFIVVGEAHNGVIAVEKYEALKPDLVVLDIVMPEMNGIETLKKIKKINKGAKVIMLSAMGQIVNVVEALLYGATDFIVKPFSNGKLSTVVNNIFNIERNFDLEKLKEFSEKCLHTETGKGILTQSQIDELIACVTSDSQIVKTKSVDEIFKMFSVREHEVNAAPEQNQVLNLLNRLVQGQEEMRELLKELVKTK